ncbi:secreted protein [Rhodococcus aetherivorans]|uniref:Secreted protein n=1 Tax=Rhodococcus aetherivorans TaxID=191292 RepID=A0ABQ0YIF2_9NOCA|nr:DUF4185 domain-containing protein [Rhodococcus aetherivorans]ETT24099.1 protein of unknown function DUF4185 [Rhodococcus rhodochrous ATCC 21198]NGP26688.1 DUF4185 domain-containing protein [Rhodococcus aetherivorans]GES36256.1 secreted protein [Rhodococcus aetherivorans]
MTTRPVKGTFAISSGFRTADRPDHDGIDIAAPSGTPIYAPVDGIVIEGADRAAGSVSGFGNWVWIDAQQERGIDLIFGHMRHSSILVKRGDRVREGQLIATVGSEGQATGPHLHFEVWGPPGRIGGDARNPEDLVRDAIEPGAPVGVGTNGGSAGVFSEAFPLPRGFYFGPLEGPDSSISGRHGSERTEWIIGLKRWQKAQGLPQTGVYDVATADAARAVQLAHGLTPDGLIGEDTWRAGMEGTAPSLPPVEGTPNLQLVDHAAARPGAKAVKADGYDGAVRYLVDSPDRGLINKKLTPEEAAGYLALGMPLVSNWQKGKNATADWRRGFDGGVADAKAADAWHKNCGGPAAAPIFFSIDDDLTLAEWNSLAAPYLRGAASVIGKQRVGAYCKYIACDWAIEDDVVGVCRDGSGRRYLWQPNTWLGGRPLGTISEHACLFQRLIHPRDNVTVAGINVDVSDTLTADFGQWQYAEQPVDPEPGGVRAPEGYDITWREGPGYNQGHDVYARIYLHTTENQDWIARAENVADYQTSTKNDPAKAGSYHYLIDDNHIVQTVSTKNTAWGVPGAGKRMSVDIAMVGTSGAIPRWTGINPNEEGNPKQRDRWLEHDKMLDMVAFTIAKVSKEHGIPIERVDTTGVRNNMRGVSSHNNYTYGSGIGTHWDVPDTFPYDVVLATAMRYAGIPDDPDRFPLPSGHYWGPLEGPQESWSNLFGNEPQSSKDGLKRWQATLDIPQSSVFDRATSDAAKKMQIAKGWPVTGHVYAGEWYGVIKDGWRLPGTPVDAGHEITPVAHKVADATGPGHTDRFGMAATDLGVMTRTPSGRILAVFGDTFRDPRVGSADWRAPVALFSDTTRLDDGIRWHEAAGPDSGYARQLLPYDHGDGTTVLPSDVITIGPDIFLHVMVNKGLGNVVRTEIWKSSDDGKSWSRTPAEFDAGLHGGFAQLWTWARDDDGWVYVFSTGFQRDKGAILRRVREDRITDPDAYIGWGWRDGQWNWGNPPTPVLEKQPSAEKFGEMCLRKIQNKWVLVNFDASTVGGYDIDIRILDKPTDNLYQVRKTTPIRGSAWAEEGGDRIAQLYGPSIVPGSTLDGGLHLLVSQWKTADGWPYRAMHFKVQVG